MKLLPSIMTFILTHLLHPFKMSLLFANLHLNIMNSVPIYLWSLGIVMDKIDVFFPFKLLHPPPPPLYY